MQKSKGTCSHCAGEFNEEKDTKWKQRGILIILSSLTLLLTGLYFEFVLKKEIVGHTLYVFVVLISGFKIMKKGFFRVVKERRFDMNFFMSIAAIGAMMAKRSCESPEPDDRLSSRSLHPPLPPLRPPPKIADHCTTCAM